MKGLQPSVRVGLWLYGAILVLYTTLVGWWVYFFSQQHLLFVRQVEAAGVALSAAQIDAIQVVTARHMRMFLYEGAFLGALLLGSIVLVLRAVRQETVLYRQQHNFLSAVTHELNTPLTAARLCVETLLAGRVDPAKADRYLRSTLADLNRLRDLVDDVLATRRLVSKRAVLDIEQVDLVDLARRRLARYTDAPATDAARVWLTAPLPVVVAADVAAVEKVVDNLLSNAFKYGGPSPWIEIRVVGEKGQAVVQVRDHGPGLQGADPVRILQPFVRGQDEDVRTRPGAGLGLFIVSEFVRVHGGTFTIADAPSGRGTLATVRLPMAGRDPVSRLARKEAS